MKSTIGKIAIGVCGVVGGASILLNVLSLASIGAIAAGMEKIYGKNQGINMLAEYMKKGCGV